MTDVKGKKEDKGLAMHTRKKDEKTSLERKEVSV